MSEQIMINAVSRSELGSNRARNIRSENMVPAVIYGNEKELLNVNIPLNELTKASQNDLFFTQVLIIKMGDNDEKVVLKELQREPMKGKLLHADFMRVSRKTMLKVTIPFNFFLLLDEYTRRLVIFFSFIKDIALAAKVFDFMKIGFLVIIFSIFSFLLKY